MICLPWRSQLERKQIVFRVTLTCCLPISVANFNDLCFPASISTKPNNKSWIIINCARNFLKAYKRGGRQESLMKVTTNIICYARFKEHWRAFITSESCLLKIARTFFVKCVLNWQLSHSVMVYQQNSNKEHFFCCSCSWIWKTQSNWRKISKLISSTPRVWMYVREVLTSRHIQ